MSGPNPLLSEAYGTAPVQPAVDEASVDTFIKVAMESGVDLDQMTQEQVGDLYMKVAQAAEEGAGIGDEVDQAAEKFAQAIAEGEGEEKKEEKKEEGEPESEKEAAEKFAQFDFAGRVIAHAQWDELKKLAQAEEAAPEEKTEEEKKEEEAKKEAGRSGGGAVEGRIREILRALRTKGTAAKHKGILAGRWGAEQAKKPGVAAGLGGAAGLAAGIAGGRATKTAEDEAGERIMQRVQEKIAYLEQDAAEDQFADLVVQKLAERYAE